MTMRVACVTRLDGPESIEIHDHPVPKAKDQLLLDVRAAGVSFPELLQTWGRYQVKTPVPFVPGTEVAGVVLEAPSASGFVPGDRVAGMSMMGGLAEKARLDPNLAFVLPERTSFEEGVAVPMNYGTAYFALIQRGQMQVGDRVLVHGASGGVGTAAIQVAKAFGASYVIAVTSTEDKGRVALAAGADEYVLAAGFKDAVLEAGGVDLVVDPVGGQRFTDSLRCLRLEGRLLVIGFADGEIPEVKVNRLLLNNISVVGVAWGAYEQSHPGALRSHWEALIPHLEYGILKPIVGEVFPLEKTAEALQTLERRTATGKTVITP